MAKLNELLQGIEVFGDICDIEINGVKIDSREVKEGDLFICLKGKTADGHLHALEAEMLGAVAIVAENVVESNIPVIKVTNTRRAYAKIAQNYYKNPILDMKFVSVVGTNGKTSTSIMLEQLLSMAGYKTGLIGTLCYKILDKEYEADLTTPDPMQLNKLFCKMKQAGVEIVIAEVSAHAIALDKLWGIKSDICIFTNISLDHLDFFGDFKTYSDTKLSFFNKNHIRAAVVNGDDELGRVIIKNANVPVISYGIDEPSDIFAIDIKHTSNGCEFVINLFDELYEMSIPFFGKHNLYNAMAAITLAKMLKVPTAIINENLQKIPQIEGRFNIFLHKNGKIIVDFAHTPDGLRNLLQTARSISDKRLITVFGCGGNRDTVKRPIMGEIAGRMSDVVIITSDNPRYERPMDIISQIEPSAKKVSDNVLVFESRKEAIKEAISQMQDGDTVVIAGKGGENYMDVRGVKTKYSDIAEVKSIIRGEV